MPGERGRRESAAPDAAPRRRVVVALLLLVLLLSTTLLSTDAAARRRFLIVRHAEKITGGSDPDPALLPEGKERARLLKEMLRDLPVVALYASQYQRTRLTLAPLSEERRIPITVYDARRPDSLVAALPKAHADGDIVIATHLGTLQKLLTGFGVPGEWDIADHEYDNLFIVSPADSAHPLEWIRLHYGER